MALRGRTNITTRLLVATVALIGTVAMAAVLVAYPPEFTDGTWHKILILAAVTAAAELISIRVKHGDSAELITMFEIAVVADMVLLPASAAAMTSVGGLAIAMIIRRKPFQKFVFNLGQYAAGIVPAIALYRGIGNGDFGSTRGLLALLGGMALFTGLNLLTISAIISAHSEQSLAEVVGEERGVSFAMGVGNSAVGMVAVSLYLTRPALLPAVLAPTIALHLAFRGWVKEKELVREMAEQSKKLGRILEHSSEGIVLADGSGEVLLWSPSMERITGVRADEAVGKAVPFLLRGKDVYGRALVLDVSDEADPVEIEIITADGRARWLRVQHGAGRDERGAITFDVLLVTDVTRQREVDKLKDDFFNTVSHELRTPLTPIKGYASLLLRRGDDIPTERRNEALQSILERTDHMARLVEDMLLASRVANSNERRMPEVARKLIEVRAIADKALRSFRIAHPTRDFVLEGEDTPAMGDAVRIEQVIANLISNAVKFSDDGHAVYVNVSRDESAAIVTVRDEGRGIPADKQEEIFEKFKRLEDPMVMETGGAGLGLFIVRQLSNAMGGSVSVDSELGRGSTFTVRLPLPGSAAPEYPARRETDAPVGQMEPPAAGRSAG